MTKTIYFLLLGIILTTPALSAPQLTLTGLDILKKNNFAQLAAKRVGIITNQSSVDAEGKNAVDVMYNSKKVNLAAIFSPEHGFRGAEEGGIAINNSTDPATGLPIFSLYGKNERPGAEMLKGLDILVFDIQDIGARFYTYLTTMAYAMEEATKNGIEFMVLDRPNPIGGQIIEGPMLADNIKAFTAYNAVPIRHGFTAGEMALYHKSLKNLNLKLTVVKMENWHRNSFFNETGVPWTNPSPNIRSVNAEILYPGLACFEATNVSMGRGTAAPFLWFGAPWMKAEELVKELSAAGLAGVKFSYEERTPDKDVFAGKLCKGVSIEVLSPSAVHAVEIFVYAAYYLKKYNAPDFEIRAERMMKMTGTTLFYEMLTAGKKPKEILAYFAKDSRAFLKARKHFLLYP